MPDLTFPGVSVAERPFRRLRWVAVVAVGMCVGSILVLTFLIPDQAAGGYLPLRTPTVSGK
jgi:hypothetical protein